MKNDLFGRRIGIPDMFSNSIYGIYKMSGSINTRFDP